VQERLARQENVGQHRTGPARYALTGLLRCGRCNRHMHGRKMRETSKGYVCDVCGASKGLLKTERAVRALMASLPVTAEQVAAEIGADVAADREQLAVELAAVDASLSKLSKRRTTLTIQRGDGEMTAEDYRAAIAESGRERDALEQQREEIQQRLRTLPQDTVLVEEALALLRALPSLVDLAADAPIEEQQQMYRACIKRVVLDPVAKTLTVEWLDHIARHMGAAQHTVQV
jgi:DNA repair exonuclease SbcCD ATPase subunit